MEVTGKILDIGLDFKSKYPKITIMLDQRCINDLEELIQLDKLRIKITKYIKRRSMDANAYFWVLCGRLADKLGQNKDDIYRRLVREIGGNYEVIPIRKDAVEAFKRNWCSGRIGWVCEELGNSKIQGYVNLIAYYGSSVYDSRQMSRLIDSVV